MSAVDRTVAHLNPPRIILVEAAGGFELAIYVDGTTEPRRVQQPIIWFAPEQARVSIGAGSLIVGTALPTSSARSQTLDGSSPVMFEFRMGLSAAQVAAIEAVRNGEDLQIRLAIAGVAGALGPDGADTQLRKRDTFSQVLTHVVPRSDWVLQLNAAKAMDILLIEIPMPLVEPSPNLASVVARIRQAQNLFVEAHYADCVINCRRAIEAFQDLAGRDRQGLLKKLAIDRDGLSKDERRTTIEAALFHFGSSAAHGDVGVFDRRDAKLALALTSALIAYDVG